MKANTLRNKVPMSPLKCKQGPTRKGIIDRCKYASTTDGDWTAENLSVVCGETTIATADLRRVPPEVAAKNIRLMASSKRLLAFVERMAKCKAEQFEAIVSEAKTILGGV